MSTSTHCLAESAGAMPDEQTCRSLRYAIITADWNSHITYSLRDGAKNMFARHNVTDLTLISVPGAVELTYAAAKCLESGKYDGVLVFGCVIRGDTPHFDYVCQIAAQGCAMLNARGDKPVIFGVLTVENEQQALDRAGGLLGNKGEEAAETALRMAAAFPS